MKHAALLTHLGLKTKDSVALTCLIHSFCDSGQRSLMGVWEWVHLERLHTEPSRYQVAQGLSFSLVMRGNSMCSVKGKEQMMSSLRLARVKVGGGCLGAFGARGFSSSRPRRARARSATIVVIALCIFASLARTANAFIDFLAAEFVYITTLLGVLPPSANSRSSATVR